MILGSRVRVPLTRVALYLWTRRVMGSLERGGPYSFVPNVARRSASSAELQVHTAAAAASQS